MRDTGSSKRGRQPAGERYPVERPRARPSRAGRWRARLAGTHHPVNRSAAELRSSLQRGLARVVDLRPEREHAAGPNPDVKVLVIGCHETTVAREVVI